MVIFLTKIEKIYISTEFVPIHNIHDIKQNCLYIYHKTTVLTLNITF